MSSRARRIRDRFGVYDGIIVENRGEALSDPLTQRPQHPRPERPSHLGETLGLVGAVRRLAFDRNLPPSDAMGRIRDAFHDYDHQGPSVSERLTREHAGGQAASTASTHPQLGHT